MRLIELQPLGEEELESLATSRAQNAKQAILDVDAELDARVAIEAPGTVNVEDDQRIRMKLTLRGQ